MKKRNALILFASALVAAFPAIMISGCRGEHETDEGFIKSLTPTGETDGTMPPVGAPMDDVARIRFETTDLDLGTVKNDQIHHHKLKVYNDGKLPLKITKIDTTCACTMGNVTPENAVVQPGQESWIDVTLDPDRVPGFTSHKVLTVTSTDPSQPQVEIQVRAHVEPEYYLETEELALGEIPKGEIVERRIRFRQIQETPAHVTGAEVMTLGPQGAKIPGITARVEEIPEAQWQAPGKREYEIIFATTPELSAGAFKRTVALLTDVKRLPKHGIYVSGTVMAPYAMAPVYPERIVLIPDATGDHAARATFTSTAPLTLSIAATSNPLIVASVLPGSTPNEVFVEARVSAANMPKKLLDETVSVQVTAEGKTYTEVVAVRNAGNAEASGEGHDHDH